MANDNKIHISTTGDPSGAEKIADAIGQIGEASDQVLPQIESLGAEVENLSAKADASATSAGQSFTQKFFPTFSKGAEHVKAFAAATKDALNDVGNKIGGLSGAIISGLGNPWAGAAALATAGLAMIGAAIAKVDAQVKAFAEFASKGFEAMGLGSRKAAEDIDLSALALDKFQIATNNSIVAIDKEIDALTRRTGLIDQQLKDDTALAESVTRLAKARIDAAAAEGRITKDEAARQKAALDQTAAEANYNRTVEASQAKLDLKQQALDKIRASTERLAAIEAEQAKAAESLASKGAKEAALEIDPRIQARVKDARDAFAQNARDAQAPSLTERAQAANEAFQQRPAVEKATPLSGGVAAAMAIYQTFKDTEKSVEEAQKALASSAAEVKAAEEARDKAIQAAEAARKAAAEEAAKSAEAARQESEQLKAEIAAEREKLARMTPGGVDFQIQQNDQAAQAVVANAVPGSAPAPAAPAASAPIDPTIFAAIPASDQTEVLKRMLADGLQKREEKMAKDLIDAITMSNPGLIAADAIKQLQDYYRQQQAQIDDLRAR